MSDAAKHRSNLKRIIAMMDERKEFVTLEDGFVCYAAQAFHGAMSAWMLRAIADELDRRNAKWQAQLENDPVFSRHE